MTALRFDVITLFPEFFANFHDVGIVGAALRKQLVILNAINPRMFTSDRHQSVDDRPFGGGDGMLMKPEPLAKAVEHIKSHLTMPAGPVILLSAHGKPLNQNLVKRFCALQQLTLVCGRYGGVDQRFIERYVDEEVSLGDFVLSGGELAAAAVIDAVARWIPGVLGHSESAEHDSFSRGGLEHPQFTRPREFDGLQVPEILVSGDHQAVARFQRFAAVISTQIHRPDLLGAFSASETAEAQAWLESLDEPTKESLGFALKG